MVIIVNYNNTLNIVDIIDSYNYFAIGSTHALHTLKLMFSNIALVSL